MAVCGFPTIRPSHQHARAERAVVAAARYRKQGFRWDRSAKRRKIFAFTFVQASAEGGQGGGVVRHESGLGNTGDAGAVSVGNADGRKAIELRTRPHRQHDEEREQSARICEAEGPRKHYGSNRSHVRLLRWASSDLQLNSSARVKTS
jgi:hypothetical protein